MKEIAAGTLANKHEHINEDHQNDNTNQNDVVPEKTYILFAHFMNSS